MYLPSDYSFLLFSKFSYVLSHLEKTNNNNKNNVETITNDCFHRITRLQMHTTGSCQATHSPELPSPSPQDSSLLVVHSNRTRSNGLKFECRKFHTNMRKNFFMVRVTEHWNRLSRDVVKSLLLWRYSRPMDAYLCNLL